MARELTEINESGELTDVKISGTGAEKSVTTKEYVDAADDLKQDTSQLFTDVKAIMEGGNLEKISLLEGAEGRTDLNLVPNVKDLVDANPMKWQGEWSVGDYLLLDCVRDGEWLMIANKNTSDRPAPIPVGDKINEYPATPVFAAPTFTGVVQTGHDYTFLKSGWVNQIEVHVPELTGDTHYKFYITNITDPATPIQWQVVEPVLVEDGWATLALGNRLVVAGTVWRVIIDALNSGSSSQVTGGWTYNGANNVSAPSAQGWNTNNSESLLRIDKTDLDSTDRTSELMGIIAGSSIQFVDTIAPVNAVSYHVDGAPVDQGAYISYVVTKTNDVGEIGIGDACTMTAEIPVVQPTAYNEEIDFWQTNTPNDWCSIVGYKAENGVSDPAAGYHCYGIRMTFQVASVSEDWDFMASSSIGGGGGGGTDVPIVYRFNKIIGHVVTDDVYEDVNELIILDQDSGVYEYGIAWQWDIDSINTSAYFRFSTDGGTAWDEIVSEAKDINDKYYRYYAFPVDEAQGTRQLKIQARKEVTGDVYNINFCDCIIKRVG